MKDTLIMASPLIGRLLIGGMFLYAGVTKILGFEQTIGFITSVGLPFPALAAVTAILIEVLGGLALILGLKVRWGAGALIVFVAVVNVVFHNPVDMSQLGAFNKNLALMGGLFYILAFGAGAYSLEHRKTSMADNQMSG